MLPLTSVRSSNRVGILAIFFCYSSNSNSNELDFEEGGFRKEEGNPSTLVELLLGVVPEVSDTPLSPSPPDEAEIVV